MKFKSIRLQLPDELMKKYKVFCAMEEMTMTQMTTHILTEYVKKQNEIVKIIKTKE